MYVCVCTLRLTRHSIVPLVRRDRSVRLQLAEHAHRLLRRYDDQLPGLDSMLRLDGPRKLHHGQRPHSVVVSVIPDSSPIDCIDWH